VRKESREPCGASRRFARLTGQGDGRYIARTPEKFFNPPEPGASEEDATMLGRRASRSIVRAGAAALLAMTAMAFPAADSVA
jgi:hypothetical protein